MSNNSKNELIWRVVDRLRYMQVTNDLFDQAAADRLGVNRTDFRVLDVLQRQGPMTPSSLAEQNDLSRPAMTTVIDRLEKAGYARRAADPTDRRRVTIEITPLAVNRAMELYAPFAEASQAEFGRYTVKELETIARFLDSCIGINEVQLERVRPAGT
jgi:DNA-binding MarR family transcriptional regulator